MVEDISQLNHLIHSSWPASRVDRFVEGAKSPFWGWRLMNKRPTLWRFAVIPVVFNLLITILVLAMLIALGGWFITEAHPWFHEGRTAWTAWLGWLMEVGAVLLLLVLAFGLTLVTYMILSGVLCGYFYGRLAEEVEVLLGKPREELQSISIAAEAIDTTASVVELIVVNVGFLIFGFIPVVGPPVALVGSTYWNWAIFGLEYLTYPLSLRGQRRAKRRAYCKRNRPHNLGLGSVVMLFQFIPILGAVPLATAAAGAVILQRRIEAHEIGVDQYVRFS